MQRRWGCPAAGHTPPAALDPDLVHEAAHVARITGTPPAATCPLACVERASSWLIEMTQAVALASDWHVPLDTTLGRDITAADLAALSALKSAQSQAMQSDRDLDARDRENARKKSTP
jgi:hypothetical protein